MPVKGCNPYGIVCDGLTTQRLNIHFFLQYLFEVPIIATDALDVFLNFGHPVDGNIQ